MSCDCFIYAPVEDSGQTPSSRLAFLSNLKSKLTLSEITPYIEEFAGKDKSVIDIVLELCTFDDNDFYMLK